MHEGRATPFLPTLNLWQLLKQSFSSNSKHPIEVMDDFSIEKIQLSGATLASLLHRASAATGDLHGYLFGHVTLSTHNPLSDDSTTSSATAGPVLAATITSFISLPSHLSLPPPPPHTITNTLLGWFSARRKTALRPSLKDSTTTGALSSSTSHSFTPKNSSLSLPPSLFLLLTTPIQDQLIHTHEYKVFQYRIADKTFEPKSLSIINIGPSFRSHYESFSPYAPFPLVNCDLRGPNAMEEDEKVESLGAMKDQKQLDMCAEGFEIGRLSKLVGSEATHLTAELEELYHKMLAKLDGLSKVVEQGSAKVLEQENNIMKLRYKAAGLE
ncbi:uncharacterized protein LOC111408033 [Olea europaea var. sylvestris]|uniref:uncharacterized protein LOC111408033 n=1 Tax=Olea europaea var. sylvestris TaxID=158386 RepID=UPI000C1D0ACF|nr:uncharacterized protein LOC111408033 [Olea europaea var. sylvestris]XP_022893549.1 uncharacterized protein LOC111408033 [Olea europaea var. sylvestris]XP_022893550.1 uncharacterized protein LOC111408033 [Olea europaea var. sylvestris]